MQGFNIDYDCTVISYGLTYHLIYTFWSIMSSMSSNTRKAVENGAVDNELFNSVKSTVLYNPTLQ